MADHPRKLIRQAVVTMLRGATRAQDRVYPTRRTPWRTVELPAIAVYALHDATDPQAPADEPRVLDLAVVGVVSLTDAVDDELDALCLEIEAALDADPTFSGAALDSIYREATIDVNDEAERPRGVASLTYAVQFAA